MLPQVETGEDGVPFVQLGEHILRLDLEDLDEEYQKRATAELRETPEVVEDAVKRLRELVANEEGLTVPDEEDSYYIKFLRPCKFYPETTFKLMKRYYKFKLKHPKLSVDLMPVHVKHVFEEEVMVFLPVRFNGSRLMVINLGTKWNPKTVSLNDQFRAVMMALEIAMIEPRTQVAGVHVLIDLQGLSLSQICHFTPSFAKIVLDFVQECTAVRLKGIHIVNQPYIFKMLYALFKPFIGEKLRKRLHFHGYDRKQLHSHIPPDYLPINYEGKIDMSTYSGKLLGEMLCMYDHEFSLCNSIGYTNSKVKFESNLLKNEKK